MAGQDSLKTRRTLNVDGKEYDYFSIPAFNELGHGDVSRLPYSLKVLFENMLRYEDGKTVTTDDVKAFVDWADQKTNPLEIAYRPARVLMQDFTGVPAVVDLAAMRDAMEKLGGDPKKINPLSEVDLVIDHSVMVDDYASGNAFKANVDKEFARNGERYEFLRWGQSAFDNFRVVPPGTGICHQVNLEYLAQTVWTRADGDRVVAFPDTLVGTDSHTTMVNGMAVLGWGVGGIEAEAAMLGQPVSMLIPDVIGFKLTGALKEGTTATDLVLMVTQMLRAKGVVGKFVEFFGPGLSSMTLADRATISNMAPEYGATCGFFPIDKETINYLTFTARDPHRVKLVEDYAKAQGLWRDDDSPDPVFTDMLELDMGDVESALAGPKRPQDRVILSNATQEFVTVEKDLGGSSRNAAVAGQNFEVSDGDVVIAAITSCTNTSNPSVLVAAGLVARKAVEKGVTVKPWVKTSLAPGSQVVTDYLDKAGLSEPLDQMGFHLVGYGCTTCIGNSGPLKPEIEQAITDNDLLVTSVLSGNRNFEGRVHPLVKANYLASPPLVVIYAIAGSMKIDVTKDAIAEDKDGNPVYMKDLWPTNAEIHEEMTKAITPEMFASRYGNVFEGPEEWRAIPVSGGLTYDWSDASTYVQNPPYFEGMSKEPGEITDITGARMLAKLGDSITTDHISPAGSFKAETPAGQFLTDRQVRAQDFNSYGSRRGNHEIMMRGTFANIRLKNELAPGTTGGYTTKPGEKDPSFIYDTAMEMQAAGTPLIVVAGKEYGTGSSRDWAAKGTRLLGVKAVIAESFERIHRSNLVGMGVLPLQFKEGDTRETLGLKGDETFDITGIAGDITPRQDVDVTITYADGSTKAVKALCRIDTANEVDYYRHGGILHYVLRDLASAA